MRLPEDAARALEKLESAGWESYAVGGCVRDSLLASSRTTGISAPPRRRRQ